MSGFKLTQYRDIKVVLVGDGAIGKTCLLIRFCEDYFPLEYIPTVFDNKKKSVLYNNNEIALQLWDTAGQEEYASLRTLSYPETDVFVLVYSIISPTSYDNILLKWKKEVMENSENRANIILVATKVDLRDDEDMIKKLTLTNEKPVTQKQGEKLRKKLKAYDYIETSALKNINVTKVFERCLDSVFKSEEEEMEEARERGEKIKTSKNQEKSRCLIQ